MFARIGRTIKADFGPHDTQQVVYEIKGHATPIGRFPQGWLGLLAILSHPLSHDGVI